ncbi:MAG TPA: FMN-binding protein, partial [Candidatus Eisenbergiella pullistercoris]|nr:FMN-binding protein [Candidatus Eisenbergiella pullistercoris]
AERFVYTKSGAAAENEIDAISSATITTEAVVDGVNAGLYYFQTELTRQSGAAQTENAQTGPALSESAQAENAQSETTQTDPAQEGGNGGE